MTPFLDEAANRSRTNSLTRQFASHAGYRNDLDQDFLDAVRIRALRSLDETLLRKRFGESIMPHTLNAREHTFRCL